MNHNNYELEARALLADLAQQIENQDQEGFIDIDYTNEVLTIEAGGKVFIINKQAPNKEIWLASPLSGPYHFKKINEKWVNKKGNELFSILSEELSQLQPQKVMIK